MPAKRRLRPTRRRVGRLLDERLHPLHRVGVIHICLVPLDLCELGRVLVRVALVAEVLRQLVHLLQPADDQPLQVELVRDSQIEILVEQVRVRHERLGEPAAVARLQDRRLHLDEALAVEVAANRGHHACAEDGLAPRLLVHQQDEVPAPVARLDVGDAVEGVRERRADAREDLDRIDVDGRLAALGLRRRPGHSDDVAEVDVDLSGPLHVAEELDAARAVDEVEKDELPHVAPAEHPSGEPALRGSGLAVRERLRLRADECDLVAVAEVLGRAHARESRAPPNSHGRGCAKRTTDRAEEPFARLRQERGGNLRRRETRSVSRRFYVHDLEGHLSARRRDLDRLALLPAHDRLPDGRLVRELVRRRIGLG